MLRQEQIYKIFYKYHLLIKKNVDLEKQRDGTTIQWRKDRKKEGEKGGMGEGESLNLSGL